MSDGHADVLPSAEPKVISIRAYATSPASKGPGRGPTSPQLPPSEWTLIFDTETTTDAAQALRFGAYQVRKGDKLWAAGLFHEPDSTLTQIESELLRRYTVQHQLHLLTREQFVEKVFFRYGYELGGSIVGLNLPFDLSRIAIGHGSARGSMRGGFSFKLSPHTWRPAIQVKHLSSRSALIRFAAPGKQFTPRGQRRRGLKVAVERGTFIDLRTLGAALLSGSHSLASLGKLRGVENQKLETDEHGEELTEDYIRYAVRDVQTSWECYQKLLSRYQAHGLTETHVRAIKSEASLGKAYLRQMGIRPLLSVQPDIPPSLLGHIMSAYYGGRSEVHVRRVPVQVLYCDFLSMYPTVCTLMGLWRFVVADGMKWRESADEIRALLDQVNLNELQNPCFWPLLHSIVQVAPDGDIFPVRADYAKGQSTIGLNYITSSEPIWYTLADCIGSKLLTGKAPKVIRAITFRPGPIQAGLRPVQVLGTHPVDPNTDDLFRTVIDRRAEVKARMRAADGDEKDRLDKQQFALKILANATSYGIFVERNAKEALLCHGAATPFEVCSRKVERPGNFFHPLLGTLITGAARLMLAIAETRVREQGLDWAFCDTDSMAIAKPSEMSKAKFFARAEEARRWFDSLNPYTKKGPLLKKEDANFAPDGGELRPLFCFAVSAKRYALFNLDERNRPVIRKATAHGLGHLLAPYAEEDAPEHVAPPLVAVSEIGVARWQYDLWYQILRAALCGHPNTPDLDFHAGLSSPAMSRYGATTPEISRWVRGYNDTRLYIEQIRPFGFLCSFQGRKGNLTTADSWGRDAAGSQSGPPRPIAPFHREPGASARKAFDRASGVPISVERLQSYREAIAQYHLHPEAKFRGGDFVDAGELRRRHIRAIGFSYIGKEADRLVSRFRSSYPQLCWTATVRCQKRWMEARISSADLVHRKGFGSAFRASM